MRHLSISKLRRRAIEVSVKHLDGVRFEVAARGNTVISDQPLSNGGKDSGMTPPEFLLGALGSCVAYYAVEYLRARMLPLDGIAVSVQADKASAPARIAHFSVTLEAPELDGRHQQGLLRAVKTCLVHNTLLNLPAIDVV